MRTALTDFQFLQAEDIVSKVECLAKKYRRVKIAVAYLKKDGLKSLQSGLSLRTAQSFKNSKSSLKLLVGLAPYYITDSEGRRYILILARDMEVYGHAIVDLTYDVDSDIRDEGYKCAFHLQQLYLLEKDGKKRIRLESIVPKGKLTNLQGGPFKLSTRPWLIKNYEKLSGEKLDP